MNDANRDTDITEGVSIDATARVGQEVIIAYNCHIGRECQIGAGVILDSTSNGKIVVEDGACIMAGAIVSGTVTIGRNALVAAGAVVTRSVPPHAVVEGNPARIVDYTTNSCTSPEESWSRIPETPGVVETGVRSVTIHRLTKVLDLRGNLTVGEFSRSVPFDVKRYFMVFGVPNAEVRGEHAHRTCHQFLICAHGRLSVVADDGNNREEFVLDDPSVGIHLPPVTWGVQYKYSADAVLLVFASELYDADEYIRSYEEFLHLSKGTRQ